ncbi:MAG: anthranilate synthase component I family protein [Chlamydia sp.]
MHHFDSQKKEGVKKLSLHFFATDFLLLWARKFSLQPGTCYLHTGKKSAPREKHSLLFLCPSHQRVEWQMLNRSNPLPFDEEYPVYGMISYEYGSKLSHKSMKDPLYALFLASLWVIYGHESKTVVIYWKEAFQTTISDFFHAVGESFETFLQGNPPKRADIQYPSFYAKVIDWEKKGHYCDKVEQVRRYIYEGNIYQLNVSYEVTLDMKSSDTFSLFEQLILHNSAPQSAFLQIDGIQSIVSCSPERLLKRQESFLYSQPIKGTKPRGQNSTEDEIYRKELQSCIKEQSELSMITDLVRHDLFQLSKAGSIEVEKSFHIESYPNVFQQSSYITSIPKEDLQPLEALLYMFPGGSITGCPKIEAMKRIYEIEERNRGVYTGSIGYALSKEQYDWNIAIRTLILNSSTSITRFSVGAGIVWDSDPEKEYIETLHKTRSFTEILHI